MGSPGPPLPMNVALTAPASAWEGVGLSPLVQPQDGLLGDVGQADPLGGRAE